jgi:hypothetical protein
MVSKKFKPIALLSLGLLVSVLSKAQELTNASGGNATGSGGTASYSIGQVVYTTHTGSNGSVAQGVQHAYDIYPVGISETALNITLTVFPNPTSDNLTLQISNPINEQLTCQLFDVQGKILHTEKVSAQQTQIDMTGLASATYFLYVVNDNHKRIQSFKIVKN